MDVRNKKLYKLGLTKKLFFHIIMNVEIKIKINKETYSWKSDYEDHNIYDIAEKFKGLLVSAGFHPDNVDEIFDECVIGSWKLPSDKNLYVDELEHEYDIFDNETNVETLK